MALRVPKVWDPKAGFLRGLEPPKATTSPCNASMASHSSCFEAWAVWGLLFGESLLLFCWFLCLAFFKGFKGALRFFLGLFGISCVSRYLKQIRMCLVVLVEQNGALGVLRRVFSSETARCAVYLIYMNLHQLVLWFISLFGLNRPCGLMIASFMVLEQEICHSSCQGPKAPLLYLGFTQHR